MPLEGRARVLIEESLTQTITDRDGQMKKWEAAKAAAKNDQASYEQLKADCISLMHALCEGVDAEMTNSLRARFGFPPL